MMVELSSSIFYCCPMKRWIWINITFDLSVKFIDSSFKCRSLTFNCFLEIAYLWVLLLSHGLSCSILLILELFMLILSCCQLIMEVSLRCLHLIVMLFTHLLHLLVTLLFYLCLFGMVVLLFALQLCLIVVRQSLNLSMVLGLQLSQLILIVSVSLFHLMKVLLVLLWLHFL